MCHRVSVDASKVLVCFVFRNFHKLRSLYSLVEMAITSGSMYSVDPLRLPRFLIRFPPPKANRGLRDFHASWSGSTNSSLTIEVTEAFVGIFVLHARRIR